MVLIHRKSVLYYDSIIKDKTVDQSLMKIIDPLRNRWARNIVNFDKFLTFQELGKD